MIDLGIVRPGTTLYIPFATYDSNDPAASVTMTGFAVTDIEIYKNGSVTQRSSDSGVALLDTDGTDFDGVTGIHGFSIDLADDTDAGFFVAGAQYWVIVSSVTVDAGTINFIAATFRIGNPNALFSTTITVTSQTQFTLGTGPAEDDALNGCTVWIHDKASAVQCGSAVVQDYTGSTKTVVLTAATTFTIATGDNISIFPPANAQWGGTVAYSATRGLAGTALPAAAADAAGGLPISDAGGLDLDARLDAAITSRLAPTVAGRTLDVSVGGEAGVDWANVGSPTTTVGLTGTTIATTQKVDVETIKTNPVVNAGTITFPTGATLASTTNITAATGCVLSTAGVDAIWDEPLAAHTTADTPGQVLNMLTQDTVTLSTDVALASIFGQLLDNGTAWSYDRTTDSLEAVRDRGDAAWTTATSVTVSDKTGFKLASDGLALVTAWTVDVTGTITTATNLTNAPTNGDLTATMKTSVNTQVATALATYDPPTNAELEARTLVAASYATAANQTTIIGDTNELQLDWMNGGRLDLLIDAIKAKTDNLPAAPAATGDIPTVAQIWTTALTEAYKTAGATGTAAQLLYEILQNLTEFALSGTTKTVKKLDGTTAKTYTLDSSTAPTSITEAT